MSKIVRVIEGIEVTIKPLGNDLLENPNWHKVLTSKGYLYYKSLAGLKRSVFAEIKKDHHGIPNGGATVKWEKTNDGIQAWIRYLKEEEVEGIKNTQI